MTQENNTDPYAGMSDHDRAMLEVAQKNGIRVEISNQQSGERTVYSMADIAPANDNKQEPAPAGEEPARPAQDEIPEKFRKADGTLDEAKLLKSYRDLEAQRSKPSIAQPGAQPAAPAAAPAVKPAAAPQVDMNAAVDAVLAAQAELSAATDDAAKAAAQAKLDAAKAAVVNAPQATANVTADLNAAISSAAAEYAQTGTFSEEALAKMESMGITREYSAAYLDGLKARAQVIEYQTWEAAGGKQQFGIMAEWAQANWSAEQITKFNEEATSGNVQTTLAAVQNLKALYDAAQGVKPTNREEPSNQRPSLEMFKSAEEMTNAMRDPKYGRDPAYTAEVERKLANSVKNNVNLGVTAMI